MMAISVEYCCSLYSSCVVASAVISPGKQRGLSGPQTCAVLAGRKPLLLAGNGSPGAILQRILDGILA